MSVKKGFIKETYEKKEHSKPEEPPGEGHKSETALACGTAGGWRRENVQEHRRGDGYK